MNIPKLQKEIFETNVKNGFWEYGECECGGSNYDKVVCQDCLNTGKKLKERSLGEMLMLVVSKLSEALEADRKGHYAERSSFENHLVEDNFKVEFEAHIKNSFEDELADTVIRLMDIAEGHGIVLEYTKGEILTDNVAENLLLIVESVTDTYFCKDTEFFEDSLNLAFSSVLDLANFDLEWHVLHKMKYNTLREFKHGKKY